MASSHATLIVKQPVHHGITIDEVLPALTDETRQGDRPVVELDVMAEGLRAIETEDWSGAAMELTRQFTEKLKPVMAVHPGARLAYFGTAPIPLAMQLGSLVGSWAAIDTYLRHHERGTWSWREPLAARGPKLGISGMPQEMVRAEGDAVIRVSTSIEVDARDTQAVVAEPLAEIDIKLEPAALDAMDSMVLLDRVAATFREALDAVSRFRPGVQTVHVFAAVPVGLAFRMGTRINPTMSPRIQTYQFSRIAEVRYRRAITLNEPVRDAIVLSDEERTKADEARKGFANEARRLQTLAGIYKDWSQGRDKPSWLDFVLADPAASERLKAPPWTALVPISSTSLVDANVDQEMKPVEDSFCFDRTRNTWKLGDDLLAAIVKGFPDKEDQACAARMLLLHEGLHGCHSLTSATSPEIGLFPKILEEVDYQADVWAMLHEYRLARLSAGQIDARALFLALIRTATRTMWAFDAGATPLYEIPVRRLNRYLIWYWQYLRIERVRDLSGVAGILSRRPVLEIAGPSVVVRGSRVYYQLDPRHARRLELAVLHDNAVRRLGEAGRLRLDELLDGLRARDGERVKEVLRGAFDQLQTIRADN